MPVSDERSAIWRVAATIFVILAIALFAVRPIYAGFAGLGFVAAIVVRWIFSLFRPPPRFGAAFLEIGLVS